MTTPIEQARRRIEAEKKRLELVKEEQERLYGKTGNDEEKERTIASLRNLIRGLKEEAKYNYERAVEANQKMLAGGYGFDRFVAQEVGAKYLQSVKALNDAILRLAELRGDRPYLWEPKPIILEDLEKIPRGPAPPSYHEPRAWQKKSSSFKGMHVKGKLSSQRRISSPLKGRGISSTFIRLRDTQTGRFVSHYY